MSEYRDEDITDLGDLGGDRDDPDWQVRGDENPLVVEDLKRFAKNIAEQMTKQQRKLLGKLVVEDAEADIESRKADMQDRWDLWGKLYIGRPTPSKLSQRANAPNLHSPDGAIAADQASARAEKYLLPVNNIAKAEGTGQEDRPRANRVAKAHNIQLEKRVRNFRPTAGTGIKQTVIFGMSAWKLWWDPVDDRPAFSVVPAEDFIVSYSHKAGLDTVQRITERLHMDRDEIRSLVKEGVFCEDCWDLKDDTEGDPDREGLAQTRSETDGWDVPRNTSEDLPMEVYEQHRMLDLDGDGIGEPYVVTVHAATKKVMRVVGRTVKNRQGKEEVLDFYTAMPFDYNPLGFYPLGVFAKVEGLNIAKNSILNLILFKAIRDSFPPKFVSKQAFKNIGQREYQLDEWIEAEMTVEDIGKAMFIPPMTQLSPVMFQLYGEVGRQVKEVVSVTDIMQGQEQPHNQAAYTTKAVREESLELFQASFRRMLVALSEFLAQLYQLNRLYLSDAEYNEMLGDDGSSEYFAWQQQTMQWKAMTGQLLASLDAGMPPDPQLLAALQQMQPPPEFPFSVVDDFADTVDLIPSADPNITSEQERMGIADAVMQMVMPDPASSDRARWAAKKQYLEALRVPAAVIADINPEPQEPGPPPNLGPAEALVAMLRGQPVAVLPDQDHNAYIQAIEMYKARDGGAWWQNTAPQTREAMERHEQERMAAALEQEAQSGQEAALPALAGATSPVGPVLPGPEAMGGPPPGNGVPLDPGIPSA